jgi:hypothetical protein
VFFRCWRFSSARFAAYKSSMSRSRIIACRST